MQRHGKQRLFVYLAAIATSVLIAAAAFFLTKPVAAPSAPTAKTPAKTAIAPTLQFAAMGDMLAHDSVVSQAKTGDSYNFTPYFTAIQGKYAAADAVFCNPETPAAGKALGISGYPTFNAPTEFARDLAAPNGARCNLINLATNHLYDKGMAGITSTIETWNAQKPLAVAGANTSAEQQQTVHYFEKNGIKVAFLAFADYSNDGSVPAYAVNFYHDKTLVTTLMSEARTNADLVVVSMHWGTEGLTTVNTDQTANAQLLADLGADVVIGTGPHVLQPVRWLTGPENHKTLVWYSLGNMLSSQLKINELTGGVATFTATKKEDKITISNLGFSPTFMSYDWLAADKAAENLAARRNLQLQPLASAEKDIQKMFGSNYSINERYEYIAQTLTTDASVKIEK